MSTGSRSTEELVRAWRDAQRSVDHARSNLSQAECGLLNAVNALGAHLCPSDAQNGEGIAIWVRLDESCERLVVATKVRHGDYKLEFRGESRARGKQ